MTTTMTKTETVTERAERIANATKDAYSYDTYGERGWKACCAMLIRRGHTDAEVEAIMRSKWTRWAADASSNRFGHHSSRDLARFLDGKGSEYTTKNVRGLVAGTY